ncbi:hypothetical protein [Nocardioides sp.]|uniref:hypothetical protein n=1 Tax=Nocardioides sp. TaxID=35761 RepID=UPI002ED13407
MRFLLTALVPLLLTPGLAGCGESPEDVRADYCEQVAEQQVELTELMAQEGPDTLLRARSVLGELAEEAPRDIADEWDRLLDALDGLGTALDAAGVDASTYDADQPPKGVTEDQQQAIARAADELAARETVAAWEGVKQHAKDVCQTPLYQ